MNRGAVAAALLAASVSLGFLDFRRGDVARGNDLYERGQYEDALQAYGNALIDEPDDPRLNFNMGNAHYKLGNYAEASASYGRVGVGADVAVADDDPRAAQVAYNLGNVQFRVAQAAEGENPEQALEAYALAMAAYRRALGVDPDDVDAKFNYEFARRALEDLQKKLEEQQEEQEQEQQNPNQEQQPEPDEQEQQGEQQPQDQEAQDEPQADPQQQSDADDSGQDQHDAEPPQGDPAEDESERGEEMSRREAAALVDMARDEELRPEDFVRQMHGAAVGEPARDW